MRAVQVSQFLAVPRLTAVTACWLSSRSTIRMSSHKNSCSKFCTLSPKCLKPSMRASTSFSAVQHEVAEYPENFHPRRKHTARLRITSFKCNPLTLRVVQASPFHSASVESSSYRSSRHQVKGVPTNSRVALRYAINLTSAASSRTGSSRPH